MKEFIKFACVYCGQHIECEAGFSARQFHCPSCKQGLVVPPRHAPQSPRLPTPQDTTWEVQVPELRVETPTRYLRHRS